MLLADGLITAGRLLAESGRLALERVTGTAVARAIPPRAGAITADWLTRVLQAAYPGARAGQVTPLGGHAGTTDRARLGVTWTAAGSGAPPPATVFVKTAPPDVRTRVFVDLMRLGATEVRFYREIAPAATAETPRLLYAATAGPADRFVLILEDLVARGARFTTVAEPVALDEARRVVVALARWHAGFWGSARLRGDLAWLRGRRDDNPRYPVERFLSAVALGPGARAFPDCVPATVRAAIPRLIACRDRLEDAWARPPLTLIHGDAHVGNMYFLPDAVGLLDWQVVQRGQGMRDVAYFLVNSVPTELRRAHQRELIDLYLTTLAALGVTALDFPTAWEQYRLHSLYAWIAAAVTAAAATLQAEPIVRTGLARSSAAVVDLDAIRGL